jgi:hypothetical protein
MGAGVVARIVVKSCVDTCIAGGDLCSMQRAAGRKRPVALIPSQWQSLEIERIQMGYVAVDLRIYKVQNVSSDKSTLGSRSGQ